MWSLKMPMPTAKSAMAWIMTCICVVSFSGVANAVSLIRDAELEAFLNDLTDPVISAAGLYPEAVDIYVVNDPTLNAFVAGGQNIFFHTGLIVAADTPNELLGVAAHETGHIAGGHLARFSDGMSAASLPIYVGLGLGLLAIAAGNPDAGMALIAGGQHIGTMEFLSYTRSQESAADQAAVTFLDRAGASPSGLVSFFDNFRRDEVLSGGTRYEYWRTHPLSSDRIGSLRQRVSESPYANLKDTPEMQYRFDMAKAKLYGFLDRPEAALRRYPASDRSDPALYGRSVAYFRTGEIDKAVGEIDALIAKDPTNPFFQELKGQILFEGGRIAASIPFHEQAVELAPFEPLLRVNLAQAIIAKPNSENDEAATLEAQRHLQKAVAFENDLIFAYHQLAITYGRQGNVGMADLSTAERYFYVGDMDGAGNFAARARDKLTEDTVAWNRAMDILNVVKIRRGKKRGRSFTFDSTVTREPVR